MSKKQQMADGFKNGTDGAKIWNAIFNDNDKGRKAQTKIKDKDNYKTPFEKK
ncbi:MULTISPECIES: hypothetical protein [unclassified Helicobacter]|uniref:hypothetical protein n=1 Tax=unclassified Helicobacter TaxID=2593540 RepID=UPI000ADF1B74|nr:MULTISPECIES: hypothetical protein [unclassified Helicobacter]